MAKRYGINSSMEWPDYHWTPVKGLCLYNGCSYCYMKKLYRRFHAGTKQPLNPELRLDGRELNWTPRTPGKIAVCLNLDLWHPLMPREYIESVLASVKQRADSIHILLTKRPLMYSLFEFPPNVWLGTTWDGLAYTEGNVGIIVQNGNSMAEIVHFVSFEPLLKKPPQGILADCGFWGKPPRWVIIGGDSSPGAEKPPIEWADQLIEEAREIGAAVWVKDNYGFYERIKEYPLSGIANALKEIGVGYNYGYDSDYYFP